MPILKTKILGSVVEINYEKAEKDKLTKIIEKFNNRLLEFKHLEGKISDNKILILAALKAEDQINDVINETTKKDKDIIDNKNKNLKIKELTQEIIKLKDEISELSTENSELQSLISKSFDGLDKMEKQLNSLTNKIIFQSNNGD